jgi:MFS family permease
MRFAGNIAVVVALCGVEFVDVLGVTLVVTALPTMLEDLHASAAQGSLVVSAYAVFFGGCLLVGARVGDGLGHRRAVLASLVLFAVASVVGAVATSVVALTAARGLQGVAAAVSVPSALRLLTTLVPEGAPRRRAVAAWTAAGASAGACGFVLGGVLTQYASWRSLFWAGVALAGLLGALTVRAVPRDAGAPVLPRLSWRSAVALTGAAMGVVAGTTLLAEQAWWPGAVILAGAVGAAVAFVTLERRVREPLVPASTWQSTHVRWGTAGSFVNTATTSSALTVAMVFLQVELDLTPSQAAGLLVGFSLTVVVGSAAAAPVVARLGWGRAAALGLLVIGLGCCLFARWPTVPGIGCGAALGGLGLGVAAVAATDLGTHDESAGASAAGVLNTGAQLGTAIGTAVVLLLAELVGARVAWMLVAALAVVAAAAIGHGAPGGRQGAPVPVGRRRSRSG